MILDPMKFMVLVAPMRARAASRGANPQTLRADFVPHINKTSRRNKFSILTVFNNNSLIPYGC